ncbi:hypothetical protein [Agromyces sp. GXS1127]|uniref:hypothetical protein n=1 Tax=Agromyces sp. GXS1127 TaxID=3424181 RepID=UPI003D311202
MPDAAGGHPATSPLVLPIVETPTDDQLIASARAGDGFAATRLWHRHESAAAAAAAATPGSADVEFVVEAAAARFSASILAPEAPVGAIRPHVLAAVREAAAAADGRGGADPDRASALLAPEEWYRADLPTGLDDGEAIAVAFTSLGTAAQEALWLAEIDGLPPVELAAELGLAPAETEGLVATAHEGLRSAWVRQTVAATPAGAECDGVLAEIGAPGTGGRRVPGRVRPHVDDCDGCRAAALPAADLAHRLVGTIPLLVLGGASGIGFLEATRTGSSAEVVAPVPALGSGRAGFAVPGVGAAAAAAIATAPAATSTVATAPASGAPTGVAATISRLGDAFGRLPRAVLVTASATLATAAAAVVVVAAISGGTPGLGSLGSSVTAGGGADISAPPEGMAPPEIIATDVPDGVPDGGVPDGVPPPDGVVPDDADAAPPSQTSPDAASPSPEADAPVTGEPGADPDSSTPPAPEPGTPPVATPGEGVSTPVVDPEPGPGLGFTVGEPGDAGWRALIVTGPPGAEFAIFDNGKVLLEGRLDEAGTASFAIRGSVAGLTIGYSSTSVTAGDGGAVDSLTARSSGARTTGPDRRLVATD